MSEPLELSRQIELWVRKAGGDRWRIEGEAQWRLLPETKEDLLIALGELPSMLHEEIGLTAYLAMLGAKLGVSGSTAWRKMDQARPRGRSMAQWVQDCWCEAQERLQRILKDRAMEAAEERAAIVACEEGRDPMTEPVEAYYEQEIEKLREEIDLLIEGRGLKAARLIPGLHRVPDGWPE